MTTTYTNITLIDIEQGEAAEWLAENGYTAVVSPTVDDVTVVYDNVLADFADEDEPVEELLKLASEMSYELGCVAWLMIVDNDEVMIYSLYADGELEDSYGVKGKESPDGGNAETLADAFGAPKRQIKTLRAALNRVNPSATDRHAKLLDALDLLPMALQAGYASIQAGTLPGGVESEDDLVFVSTDDTDEDEA